MQKKMIQMPLAAFLLFMGVQAVAEENEHKGAETESHAEIEPQRAEIAEPGSHHPIIIGPQVSILRSQSATRPPVNDHAASDAYMVPKEYKNCPFVADAITKMYFASNSPSYQNLIEKSVGEFGGTSSFMVTCFKTEEDAKTRGFSASR